jgi:hypothetical protein
MLVGVCEDIVSIVVLKTVFRAHTKMLPHFPGVEYLYCSLPQYVLHTAAAAAAAFNSSVQHHRLNNIVLPNVIVNCIFLVV